MKKFVYTLFIAFWASVGTLVLVNMLVPDAAEQAPQRVQEPTETARYSLSEVTKHATLEDCWMVIEGTVYDVSDYVPRHPAPPSVLEPWCGREATEGMRTKGEDSDHSARAWRMLERYRVGGLEPSRRD
ncbi:MAG: cytochrome B5 [Xanthomonadales bacterium]|nr:cytochrome B5 [Xanthomonadales bacterium]|tara:strand:+ start:591 stop:977 length:387 start_codon:yes stop_codon:yes gene_type:complete